MKKTGDLALAVDYHLDPKGDSSREYLRLLREPYDEAHLEATRRSGQELENMAREIAWRETLCQWPPKDPEAFGNVMFFRMFSSSTQRGLDEKHGPKTPEGIKAEKEKWIVAMLRVQDHIDRGDLPTFEKIQALNAMLGHKPRTANLNKNFSCFNASDLPEAIAAFDDWFAELLRQKLWPVQLATLVASYLIAIHPFENANGRTARLVLDWILGIHGLPPVSFSNRLQAILSRSTNEWDVPHHVAVRKTAEGIRNTLKIIQGQDILANITMQDPLTTQPPGGRS